MIFRERERERERELFFQIGYDIGGNFQVSRENGWRVHLFFVFKSSCLPFDLFDNQENGLG